MDARSPVPAPSAEDLRRVLRILKQATGPLDPRTLYQSIVDAIAAEFEGLHIVNLAMVFPATGRLVTVAASGADAERIKEMFGGLLAWPIDTGIMGWVARNGLTRYAPDASADPLYYSGRDLAAREGSELALPVKVEGEVVAVLNIEACQRGAFSPTAIAILEAVADHIGAAIQNALLHEQVREESERLSAALTRLRAAEAAFAAVVSALAARVWLVDASGRIESEAEVEEGRVHFHAARSDSVADDLADASRPAWEGALARAAEGQASEAVVAWRDAGRASARLRLFPIEGEAGRILVLGSPEATPPRA